MEIARAELRAVLLEARSLLALPRNVFRGSPWADEIAVLREIDSLLAALESGRIPSWLGLASLFAPPGPIHKVSLKSGWENEYLKLAKRFDAAEEAFYFRNPSER